ncbi:sulfotransferase domain-containing protein [Peribacillus phoenicis]|uniref:sulfotransferase domain-containing protein n=1 Tax=unclassified Peribacillus TaxID=2675266 RepID=UPI0039A06FA6
MTQNKLLLPKIFINSVPKSGTNLLTQIIKGIPNIYQERFFGGGHENEVLKLKQGEMLSSHIPYDSIFSSELQSQSIKQVFIYRDLRDVAVSMVYFINEKLHEHPLYPVFQKRLFNFEDQLNAVILGIDLIGEEKNNKWGLEIRYPGIYEEFHMIYEWRKDPTVCSLCYEDLINYETKDKVILKIIDYLWEDLIGLDIEKRDLLHLMKKNIDPKRSWTFREGKTGSWREEFTEENKLNFKEKTGDFLIELGFEENNNW